MDLPFLLGTAFTDNRRQAKAIGYVVSFRARRRVRAAPTARFSRPSAGAAWRLGALLGALHALFTGTVLVNVLLPIVHPRIGDAGNGRQRRRR